MSKIAVDTNVLLYFLDTSLPLRRKIAADIIAQQPIFNSQSLSELINVLNRRWKYPKMSIIKVVTGLLEECKFVSLSHFLVLESFELINKYDFQIFDAMVVASALEAGCDTLYSEDMQHNLIVEGQLTIINPFI